MGVWAFFDGRGTPVPLMSAGQKGNPNVDIPSIREDHVGIEGNPESASHFTPNGYSQVKISTFRVEESQGSPDWSKETDKATHQQALPASTACLRFVRFGFRDSRLGIRVEC